jgi:hypothetical protein
MRTQSQLPEPTDRTTAPHHVSVMSIFGTSSYGAELHVIRPDIRELASRHGSSNGLLSCALRRELGDCDRLELVSFGKPETIIADTRGRASASSSGQ